MNAKELIEKGEIIKNNTEEGSYGLQYIKLLDYGQWTSLCSMYLEANYPTNSSTKRFIDLVKKSETRMKDSFEELIGIMKGFSDWEEPSLKPTLKDILANRDK